MQTSMECIAQELNRISIDIAELHQSRKVTEEAKAFGLQTGEALDVSTGSDPHLPSLMVLLMPAVSQKYGGIAWHTIFQQR